MPTDRSFVEATSNKHSWSSPHWASAASLTLSLCQVMLSANMGSKSGLEKVFTLSFWAYVNNDWDWLICPKNQHINILVSMRCRCPFWYKMMFSLLIGYRYCGWLKSLPFQPVPSPNQPSQKVHYLQFVPRTHNYNIAAFWRRLYLNHLSWLVRDSASKLIERYPVRVTNIQGKRTSFLNIWSKDVIL